MINTKLILVDGITGSGKSTTAHYIARHLEKNGIKAKWLYEQERDHPIGELAGTEGETDDNFLTRVTKYIPKKWLELIEEIKNDDFVYIIESYLFQDFLFELIGFGLDEGSIKKNAHSVYDKMKILNPAVIYLYQDDTEKHQRKNWEKRGSYFKEGIIEETDNTPYCKSQNLLGEDGAIKLWNELASLSSELYNELDFLKIKIEISEQKWDNYRKQIIKFLDVTQLEETVYKNKFSEYFGNYAEFVIHEKDGRLCVDAFCPNLKLILTNEDEFDIEGFPISFKFIRDNFGVVKELKFSKALCYYKEGQVMKKNDEGER